MLQGPVGSPYPGQYVCFPMAALCATIAWRSTRNAMQTIREQRKSGAKGIIFKPDTKKSVGANVEVALVATLLLATLLVAVYTAWPN
jgi:hypothetical protein